MSFFGSLFSNIGSGVGQALRSIGPGGLIGGALGGPLGMGAASLIGGALQNASARRAADTQMAFQERMSSTAWQRGVEDMRKAGINPIMAASQGPASSPGGSQADVPANPIASAASSALAAVQARQSMALQGAQVAAAKAQAANTQVNTAYTAAKMAADFGSSFKGGSLYAAGAHSAIAAANSAAHLNSAKSSVYEPLVPLLDTSARGIRLLLERLGVQ